MKIINLIIALTFNSLFCQQYLYNPTKADTDSIYAGIERIQLQRYFQTNPVYLDISEATRDSIFLMLINDYRRSKGLCKLTYLPALDSACELHTKWMLKERKVGHEETSENLDGRSYPKVIDRVKRYDRNNAFRKRILFENCGGGGCIAGNDPTIRYRKISAIQIHEIFNGWKLSPGHNIAMLKENVKYLGFYIEGDFDVKRNNYITLGTMLVSE
jgi:uncharacterized protein YkwD